MICNACRNEFLSGTCLTCGVHSLMAAEYESCRSAGRREMLWLTAVAACWGCWFSVWDWHPDAMIALHDVSMAALRALADMGDERARELLR